MVGDRCRRAPRVKARPTRSNTDVPTADSTHRTTMAEVHMLHASSPDAEQILPIILTLSNDVFQPESQSRHTSLDVWKARLASPSSYITYVTSSGSATPPNAEDAIAFLFVHPRTHDPPLHNGQTESLHIWLAGVRPAYRKMGLLRKMVDKVLEDATGTVTICTIPPRFPDMWAWLTKRGWNVEREAGEGRIYEFVILIG